jgi:hypothetical protein
MPTPFELVRVADITLKPDRLMTVQGASQRHRLIVTKLSPHIQRHAKMKPKSRAFSQRVKLTPEEFASLKEVAVRPPQRTIPDVHRERLAAGK